LLFQPRPFTLPIAEVFRTMIAAEYKWILGNSHIPYIAIRNKLKYVKSVKLDLEEQFHMQTKFGHRRRIFEDYSLGLWERDNN
jgi:hypothetical protein